MSDELIAAARSVLEHAERAGARVCFGSGDEPDTWLEYKEVPVVCLDRLQAAVDEIDLDKADQKHQSQMEE